LLAQKYTSKRNINEAEEGTFYAISIYKYVPEEPTDELGEYSYIGFDVNERIKVTEQDGDWWKGIKLSTQEEGYFLAEYVEKEEVQTKELSNQKAPPPGPSGPPSSPPPGPAGPPPGPPPGPSVTSKKFEIDEKVEALWEDDGQYYPAIIKAKTKKGYTIIFPDYDYTTDVSASSLRSLKPPPVKTRAPKIKKKKWWWWWWWWSRRLAFTNTSR